MNTTKTSPFLGLVGRLIWMLLGPLALALIAFTIVRTGNGWMTGADLAFLVVLGIMLLGRWLEFQGGNPQTADGQPATRSHLYRYLVTAGIGGLGVWVIANLLGNHWLAS